MIEGLVYNQGVPENGVVVRVAKEPGAYPLVDDFVSGNSAIDRGKPDPNHPGAYTCKSWQARRVRGTGGYLS